MQKLCTSIPKFFPTIQSSVGFYTRIFNASIKKIHPLGGRAAMTFIRPFVWSSHIHKMPLQIRSCSLITLCVFCTIIISCSLTSKEKIYCVSLTEFHSQSYLLRLTCNYMLLSEQGPRCRNKKAKKICFVQGLVMNSRAMNCEAMSCPQAIESVYMLKNLQNIFNYS